MRWSEKYPPHPAAEAFPMIEGKSMEDLVADVRANGVREPVVLWREPETGKALTLDGRNRFEASERAGMALLRVPIRWVETDDPAGYVISANVHRRHLTWEQRREVLARLLSLDPSRSDRQLAKAVGVSHPTVGKVRREMEESGDVVKVSTRADTLGRSQPVRVAVESEPEPEAEGPEFDPTGAVGNSISHLSPQIHLPTEELEKLIPHYATDAIEDGITADLCMRSGRLLLLVAAEMRTTEAATTADPF